MFHVTDNDYPCCHAWPPIFHPLDRGTACPRNKEVDSFSSRRAARLDRGIRLRYLPVNAGVRRQYFGYPPELPELGEALSSWCHDAYGWDVDPTAIVGVPDVVRGLRLAITHFTDPGSPIVIPTPTYMPFFALLDVCDRPGVFVPMIQDTTTGRWIFDLDGLERAFANGAGSMILCNPHNPLGTAFTADELRAVTDLAARYDVRIFSDEIHGPLVYDRPHIPTASVSETAARVTITATATSKGWNTAGLKCAQLIFTNPADK